MARGNLELAARHIAHARGTRDVATVVEGQPDVVVLRLIEGELAALDEIVGEFADVLRDGIALIEEIERPRERIQEIVRDPPGMAAFAENKPLHLQRARRVRDALRDLLHVLVGADEHAEIRGFGSVRAERP